MTVKEFLPAIDSAGLFPGTDTPLGYTISQYMDGARAWCEARNALERVPQMKWSVDVGVKIDYDTVDYSDDSIMFISSRFYGPHRQSSKTGWDGYVTLYFCGEDIYSKKLEAEKLEEIADKAETLCKRIIANIKEALAFSISDVDTGQE